MFMRKDLARLSSLNARESRACCSIAEPGRSRFEGEAYSWLSSIVRREGEMICKDVAWMAIAGGMGIRKNAGVRFLLSQVPQCEGPGAPKV